MNTTVDKFTSDRSDAEAARAAPVSLPAGAFNAAELGEQIDKTALAKADKTRDADRAEAIAKANKTSIPTEQFGVPPLHKRVAVEDKALGITENRVVFDKKAADEAQEQAEAEEAADDKGTGKAASPSTDTQETKGD